MKLAPLAIAAILSAGIGPLARGEGRGEAGKPPEAAGRRSYRINGVAREFVYDREAHLLISADCANADGTFLPCDAHRAISRVTTRGFAVPRGGADGGAVACRRQLGAKVRTGVNAIGAEATFCLFRDGSLVSTGSLDFHAHKNAGDL